MDGPKNKRDQVLELAESMIADLDQRIEQLDAEDHHAWKVLIKSRSKIVRYLQKLDQQDPSEQIIPPDFA